MSEDLTCVAAGILAGRGELAWSTALLGCYVGIVVGDGLLWLLGRTLGRKALQLRLIKRLVTPRKLAVAEDWFNRNGLLVVLISRFLPGSRFPAYLCAGMLGTKARGFLIVAITAAAFWTPALIWLSSRFGILIGSIFGQFEERLWITLPLAFLAIWIVLKIISLAASGTERKLWKARWARRKRWEFWPLWIFQAPVFLYSLWLAIRFRGYRNPLATNPGIPFSGFVGESKFSILQKLGLDQAHVAKSFFLTPAGALEDRVRQVETWRQQNSLEYPLIVKPDVSQRGSGLRRVHSAKQLQKALDIKGYDLIIQEYLDLPCEYGVSWLKEPGAEEGQITGITLKDFPEVVGDGKHNLQDLVLLHPRQRLWARLFMRRLGSRAVEIPPRGEIVKLAVAGNHSQGTTFRDGTHLQTPELARFFDEILAPLGEEFSLGRFDVRAPSVEDFQAGKNIRIIELNGVTGEATNIYDPDRSLWSAWKESFVHWHHAFRIGSWHRRRGFRPASYAKLFKTALQTWRQIRHHPMAD